MSNVYIEIPQQFQDKCGAGSWGPYPTRNALMARTKNTTKHTQLMESRHRSNNGGEVLSPPKTRWPIAEGFPWKSRDIYPVPEW